MHSQADIFRFAPSPNGELHLGHAFSALFTDAMARANNGTLLLRIEDIDTTRCRKEFETQILDDLAWLGLVWKEPVRKQSDHFHIYEDAVNRLASENLLYPCFATRSEISKAISGSAISPYPEDPDGAPIYPQIHKHLSETERETKKAQGLPFAYRLDMQGAIKKTNRMLNQDLSYLEVSSDGNTERIHCDPSLWGDVIIARKDVPTSYHLSVVIDDAFQEITHVTRGKDLQAATSIHRVLQTLLNLPEPVYTHHDLILDRFGRKLSKRHKDRSIRSLRREGATPEDIVELTGIKRINFKSAL